MGSPQAPVQASVATEQASTTTRPKNPRVMIFPVATRMRRKKRSGWILNLSRLLLLLLLLLLMPQVLRKARSLMTMMPLPEKWDIVL
jgi:hypothetical protein